MWPFQTNENENENENVEMIMPKFDSANAFCVAAKLDILSPFHGIGIGIDGIDFAITLKALTSVARYLTTTKGIVTKVNYDMKALIYQVAEVNPMVNMYLQYTGPKIPAEEFYKLYKKEFQLIEQFYKGLKEK